MENEIISLLKKRIDDAPLFVRYMGVEYKADENFPQKNHIVLNANNTTKYTPQPFYKAIFPIKFNNEE